MADPTTKDGAGAGTEPTNNNNGGGTQPAGGQGQTFTQADVDRIIGERLAREKEKSAAIPEGDLKAFKEWQKNQKTEAERAAEREAEYQKATRENAMLKAEKKVISAQTKPEFAEFVAEKVLAMGDDFEKNLTAYKKDHPQYFGETVVKRVATGASVSGGGGGTPATTNELMNGLIRSRGH